MVNIINKLEWSISLQANEDIESPLRNFSFNISHQVPAKYQIIAQGAPFSPFLNSQTLHCCGVSYPMRR